MKTDLTRQAERLLWERNDKMGTFGCFEVTIGWYGNEIVDFMTYNTNSEFRCYEIKVSKADFYSKNRLTFCGHFNYLVMPAKLYDELLAEKDLDLLTQMNSYGTGVYIFDKKGIYCVQKAKRKRVRYGKAVELLEYMLRSSNREVKKFYKEQPYWEA